MTKKLLEIQVKPNGRWEAKTRIPQIDDLSSGKNAQTEDVVVVAKPKQYEPTARQLATRLKKGNKVARGRRPQFALLGIDMRMLDIKDPKYRTALKRARFYLERRSKELFASFGYVSAGVSGFLSTAALQLAASKYITQVASEHLGDEKGMSSFIKLMDLATRISNAARQNEITAWELCAKESAGRKAVNELAPWLSEGPPSLDTAVADSQIANSDDNSEVTNEDDEV